MRRAGWALLVLRACAPDGTPVPGTTEPGAPLHLERR